VVFRIGETFFDEQIIFGLSLQKKWAIGIQITIALYFLFWVFL